MTMAGFPDFPVISRWGREFPLLTAAILWHCLPGCSAGVQGPAEPGRGQPGWGLMCNLYRMTSNVDAIRRVFKVGHNYAGNLPAFDALYPAQDVPVVFKAGEADRGLALMSWGYILPQEDKAPKRVTNARSDRVTRSPFWKDAFHNRRCLVPATAFCEWTDARPKRKVWFGARDAVDGLFAFAGIWSHWRGRLKDELMEMNTMAFLTCPANNVVAPVHAKAMPVLLSPDQFDTWIDGTPEDALALARPHPDEKTLIFEGMDAPAGEEA